LLGDNAAARSAAFLPLLVPGLARCAASINNDNLAILIGAVLVLLSVCVMTGDRNLRTAVLLAAGCVAASVTKATILFVVTIVPLAYLFQCRSARSRSGRSLPSRSVLAALVLGAIASAAWLVHNDVAYGALQPDASGNQFAQLQGPVRGVIPVDVRHFAYVVSWAVPSRFWGALALLEPPQYTCRRT